MTRPRRYNLLCLTLFWLTFPVQAEVFVIVNREGPLQSLSADEIANLYLGRMQTIAGGEHALVLDQPRDSNLRARFFSLLNGMDLRRVNAYWARLQFSGGTQPPPQLPDSKTVLDAVRKNRLAIGYVDGSVPADEVRIILTLNK